MNKNVTKDVLKKIQSEKIPQHSESFFMIKHTVFWIIFGLFVLLGSLGCAVMIYAFSETDFNLIDQTNETGLGFFLSLIPFFWIVFFGLFVGISVWRLKKIGRNYRIPIYWFFFLNLVLSFGLGWAVYALGGAEKIEAVFAKTVPIYTSIEEHKIKTWSQADKGLLSGEILEIFETNKTFSLKDFNEKIWTINYTKSGIRGRVQLKVGEKIKVIGTQKGATEFIAKDIRPWKGRGRKNNHQDF